MAPSAEAVAHAVVAGEVARGLGGGHDVVGRDGMGEVGQRDVHDPRPLPSRGQRGLRGSERASPARHPPRGIRRGPRRGRPWPRRRALSGNPGPPGRRWWSRAGSWPKSTDETSATSSRPPGEDADLVERGREGHEAVAAHPPVGGLEADHAAEGRGLADRATGVRAEGERDHAGRHRRRRPAGRPAGDAGEVPRVLRLLVGAVLGGRAHRELVHVGLAEDDRPCPLQPRHRRRR